MGSLYQNEFNFDSPNQDDMNAPANVHSELDLNRELEKYLGNNTDTVYESAPVAVPESPAPVYTPPVSNRGSRSPKLTDDQIKRYIEAKCWVIRSTSLTARSSLANVCTISGTGSTS